MSAKKVKLGDVACYIRGITFKPADVVPAHSPDSVVCMTTKNVQATLDESKLTAVHRRFVKRDEQYLQCGDILISSANSWNLVGKATYVPKLLYAATAGGFIAILRAQEEKVDSRYLYHWIAAGETQHRARLCARQTTNIANLDRERFLGLKIPLPPLPEQRRIAAILDKADAVRRKRQHTLDLADQFLRSAFLDLFGDPSLHAATIGELLEDGILLLHKDGNHGSQYPRAEEFGDAGIPFLTARSITDSGTIDDAHVQRLVEEKARQLKIGWLEEGDVLLAHNATVGRTALYRGEYREALIGTSLTAFRPDPNSLLPQYLLGALASERFQRQLASVMSQTTRNQVPITAQRRLSLPIPAVKEQREYALLTERTANHLTRLNSGLTTLRELQNSLTQRAFQGRLPQPPGGES